MNKKYKIMNHKKGKYGWAIRLFVLSICFSSIFSLLSQAIISSLGLFFSILTLFIFIFVAILFDMIGIAVTSCNKEFFLNQINLKVKGGQTGLKLCQNAEKVCSFCADMVGDICGILAGAGGGHIILVMVEKIDNPSLVVLISTAISALIAGITIFGKAVMKDFAIKNSNSIILRVGKLVENPFLKKNNNF